jgi:hypothetical protein
VVWSVEPDGAIEFFNNKSPDQAVREGDVILAVNGAAGFCRTINEAVLAGRALCLTIERGVGDEVEWNVETGDAASLGMQFDTPSQLKGSALRVARVQQQPSRWASSSNAIRRGDLILQVNAECASAAAMAAELRKEGPMTLFMSRKRLKNVRFQQNLVADVFSTECQTMAASSVPDEPCAVAPHVVVDHLAQ